MQKIAWKVALFLQRYPLLFLLLVTALVVGAVPGVFMIEISSGLDLFLDRDSRTFKTYDRYHDIFGGEPILVLLEGNVPQILASPQNRQTLAQLEEDIARDPRYVNVLSPATFLTFALEQITPPLDPGMLDNPEVIRAIVFEDMKVRPELNPVIPKPDHILITLVPSSDVTDEDLAGMLEEVEERFKVERIQGAESTISGEVAALQAINDNIRQNFVILFGLAIVVMFFLLYAIFRVRWRLLPLLMVLIATLWTFGLMGYFGISLSMATLGVLPIIIGLGIDYSVQFQNRYEEELRRRNSIPEALSNSIAGMSTAVGIAWAATTIGFLTLMISNVPMVRDFGILLILGIFLSYLVAYFLLNAILAIRDRKALLTELKFEAREGSHREERVLGTINRRVVGHVLVVWCVALVLFFAGAGLDHTLPVTTDWEALMPQDVEELQDLQTIRNATGYAGELTFLIENDNVLHPEVLAWMLTFGQEQVTQHEELTTVSSPAAYIVQVTGGVLPTDEQQAEQVLNAIPSPLSQRVINPERSAAAVSFPVRPMPLESINDLVQQISAEIESPPDVSVSPTGSLVMGSQTVEAVVGTRLPMIVAGVLGVFGAVLLIYRSLRRALFVILPMVLIIGWSSLAMRIFNIPINPLTAILAAIIIGIATEFAVLLTERYQEELNKGRSPRDSMLTASSNLGRAIVASAITTLGGFAVLIASGFVMLRDFGLVTVMIVFLSLVAVIIVLPPLVVWFDNRWLRNT